MYRSVDACGTERIALVAVRLYLRSIRLTRLIGFGTREELASLVKRETYVRISTYAIPRGSAYIVVLSWDETRISHLYDGCNLVCNIGGYRRSKVPMILNEHFLVSGRDLLYLTVANEYNLGFRTLGGVIVEPGLQVFSPCL